MFNPEEIIFAATTACNLHCAHCYVNRDPKNLNAEKAIAFLESCKGSPIEKVGFSGGEPFLALDFMEKVISFAYKNDFYFDRIMTNADWWKDENDLQQKLRRIYDAGYDGKIGISYDDYHGQKEERMVTFIKAVLEIFGEQSLEIQSVIDDKKNPIEDKLSSLAEKMDLDFDCERDPKSGRGFASLSDGQTFISASIQAESYQSQDKRAWKDNAWFEDDFCQGPGQIFFVHPSGDIAPCCGFANENPSLFIGNINTEGESFDSVMERSKSNYMVKLCYEKGLSSVIKNYEKKGCLPGKSCDLCTFCDFVMKNPL